LKSPFASFASNHHDHHQNTKVILVLQFMSQTIGQSIGNCLGEYLEYDEKNNNPWHPYLRIRVFIDVRKPLKRTKRIKKQGNEVVEVSFKFEHLGTFCYLCGLLGHSDDYCAKLLTLENDDGTRIWVRN